LVEKDLNPDLIITKVQRRFFSVFGSFTYLISFHFSFIFVRNRFGEFGTFGTLQAHRLSPEFI